ncbi:MAG TPA: hypothetical protein VFV81_09840, partial [Verrucomicrobiae bacterium]|nr:hypothetical protein [Verrucomicrobiae bacterium]
VRQCHADQSHRKWARRVAEVYTVYANRADAFAPVREALPKDLKILGMTSADDPEPSLWQPFGSRRIEYVCPEDSAQNLKSRGIEYVLLKGQAFGPGHFFPEPVESWIKSMNGQTIEKFSLNLRAATGPADWYLVKLN